MIRTHTLPEITALEPLIPLLPGTTVRLVGAPASRGIVIGVHLTTPLEPMVVTVMWSVEPLSGDIGVNVQHMTIHAESRMLKTKWHVEEGQHVKIFGIGGHKENV